MCSPPYSSSPQATPHLQLVLNLSKINMKPTGRSCCSTWLLEQMRRLALGSKPRLVDRGRILVRPERLLHVLAAAAAAAARAVAAAAATCISHTQVSYAVSETVRVDGSQ